MLPGKRCLDWILKTVFNLKIKKNNFISLYMLPFNISQKDEGYSRAIAFG